MEKLYDFVRRFSRLCSYGRVSTSAAALSYYLTLSFFPLIICLYTLLGNSYEKALSVLELAKSLIAPETISLLGEFLDYVVKYHNSAMLFAGLVVLVSTASAAERSLHAGIGKLQGGVRFQGISGYVFSVVFALLFLAAIYFAVVVMLMSRDALTFVSRAFKLPGIGGLRFVLLAGIELFMLWGVYALSKRPEDKYTVLPGAAFAALALTVVSIAFSLFMGLSSKYPLVYGSLASMILLMLWLYTCCLVIYLGAVLNVCIKDME